MNEYKPVKQTKKEKTSNKEKIMLTHAPSGQFWHTFQEGNRRRAEHDTAPSVCSWEPGRRPWSPTYPSPDPEPEPPTGQSPDSHNYIRFCQG